MKHFIKNRTSKRKTKRLNKKSYKIKSKNKKTKRGGRKYDNPKDLPFLLTYQDITDNSNYLIEVTEPKKTNSYEINQIYVIQQYTGGDQNYNKYIVKSKLENEIVVIPVLSKGSKYAKFGNVQRKIKVNNIQYAYKVLDVGYVNFSKITTEMQDENLNLKSTTPAYQQVLQSKELPDKIKSFFNPSDDKDTKLN